MTLIKEHIKRLAGEAPMQVQACKVKSVNESDYTCDCEPVDESADFLDVRLRSIVDNNATGLVSIPKVGSIVLVALIANEDAEAFVVSFSELDKIIIENVGGMTTQWLSNVINLNGDGHKGLVKVVQLTQKLNAVENKLNALLAKYNAHTHPYVNVSSPAVTSPTTQLEPGTVTPTQQSDIENTKVKHG